MTRGRPPIDPSPRMKGSRPVDQRLYWMCKLQLKHGSVPTPPLVRELMKEYVTLVEPRRMTGHEIVAAVEHLAIEHGLSLGKCYEVLADDRDVRRSVKAVKRRYEDHRKRSEEEIDAMRLDRARLKEEEKIAKENLSPEDRKKREQDEAAFNEKFIQYRRLERELFG